MPDSSKPKYIVPILGDVISTLAPRIGATFLLEPEWGIVGQITFKSGRRRYIKYSSLDANAQAAAEIAKDKGFSEFFMGSMGYPVIEGRAFFSADWARTIGSDQGIDAAHQYAQSLGFPVMVKPNAGSQGVGVCKAFDRESLKRALEHAFTKDRVVLVQRVVTGRDYRIVVLDDEIILGIERTPLNVTGDGEHTVAELLDHKLVDFVTASGDTVVKATDDRVTGRLKEQGLTADSVPAAGQKVFILDNANLSTGGDAVEVTDAIHAGFKEIAVRLTKDMGLRLCAVDLMIEGDINDAPDRYHVLEVNASPGFDHYARLGDKQRKVVEDLYLKILEGLDRD
jgi:D-alanine-D-alanine ligase-like ATP-grasp enzyme